VDSAFRRAAAADSDLLRCGLESEECCYSLVGLHFIEAAYLSHQINKILTRDQRQNAIERALVVSKKIREFSKTMGVEFPIAGGEMEKLHQLWAEENIPCPLNVDSRCQVYAVRPIACRLHGVPVSLRGEVKIFGRSGDRSEPELDYDKLDEMLIRISTHMLQALTSSFSGERELIFTLPEVISGRFVQQYFNYLAASS